jgi:quercetin dioxygenase-like cupin family protein
MPIVLAAGEAPVEGVSHNGAIQKEVFLRNGDVGRITQFARSVFPPGACAAAHAHGDMAEAFLVTRGTAHVVIDGAARELAAGSFFAVQPGEVHEITNPEGGGALELG